jgi:coenzyme F420-dependent glucose-6-phosphate dehydrogenase
MKLGYALSSEEHGPLDLVKNAQRAEQAGFSFAMISDHFHPWTDRQGQSPFVWAVLGGIAATTKSIQVGTGVTCPTIRVHPAIIAQAAATAAAMMPGRFWLGLGTGENLNEHIVGERWPPPPVRLEMLEEAMEIIRHLWEGDWETFYGEFYTVEYARVYTRPEKPPPMIVAAGGPRTAELAGRMGDGIIAVTPEAGLVEKFRAAGGKGRCIGQMKVCWARSEAEARRTAYEWWPVVALKGGLGAELSLPRQFEQASEMLSEQDVAGQILCGPDPQAHIQRIREFAEAGYDHVYVHQVGPEQEGFFEFYEREVMPAIEPMVSQGIGGRKP